MLGLPYASKAGEPIFGHRSLSVISAVLLVVVAIFFSRFNCYRQPDLNPGLHLVTGVLVTWFDFRAYYFQPLWIVSVESCHICTSSFTYQENNYEQWMNMLRSVFNKGLIDKILLCMFLAMLFVDLACVLLLLLLGYILLPLISMI